MIEWSWRIERRRSIQFGSFSSDRTIESGIASLAGPTVVELESVGQLPELRIALSDGRALQSFMTARGQPQWTLFLQDGSWLHVARGGLVHDVTNQGHRSARPSSA